MTPARRLSVVEPYYFAQLAPTFRALEAQGIQVIRMDMGAPDGPPPTFVIDTLAEGIYAADVHAYAPYGGTPAYRQAWAEYYRYRFGVDLDPITEVVGLIGSKEGIFHLTQAWVDPGDVVLVPDPGYLTYARAAKIAGAEVVYLPLKPENRYFPDLKAVPENVARRAKLLWLNYPNNPTGATVTLEQLAEAVAFARRYNILVAHDAAYVDVVLDENASPPSILQVPEAKTVAVEFNSLSKRANMAGWRLGVAVGHAEALKALYNYKSQVDSSHFRPMMDAGVVALTDPRMEPWIAKRNAIYRERRDLVLAALPDLGMEAETPVAGMYVWARLPQGWDSFMYCRRALEEAGVSLAPGRIFGPHGEGYVRFSLGTATEAIEEGLKRLRTWWRKVHDGR